MQAGHLDAELPPVAWFGQGDVAHVVLEVEGAVLDPPRMVEVAGDAHRLLPERPRQVEAWLEVGEDPLERHLLPGAVDWS